MDVRNTLLLSLIFLSCCGVNTKPFKSSDTTLNHRRHKRLHNSDSGSLFDKIHSVDEAMAILERLKLKTKRQTESDETGLKVETQVTNPLLDTLTLNSEPVRPALGLEDRANLLRIRSYLKAIRTQLDNIDHADRTKLKAGTEPTEIASLRHTKHYYDDKASKKSQQLAANHSTTPDSFENIPFLKNSTTPSTSAKAKNTSDHNVVVREVTKSNSPLSIKHQITESFIKTFDVIKQALVEFDRDVERRFRQLNDLDTDHFNMADSDVKANGDRIDRLQKYVVEDLNSCRTGLANISGENERNKKDIRNNIEQIKNITQSLLNITRIINDRTERISEIKERELKMALIKEQHRKAENKTCTKHHCKKKGKGLVSKQRLKVPYLLQKAFVNKTLNKTPRSSSNFKGEQHLKSRTRYHTKHSRDRSMTKNFTLD